MAAMIKFRNVPALQRYLLNNMYKNSRSISTSKKNDETVTTTVSNTTTVTKSTNEDKNWVSYGFDYTSKEEDTNAHHASFFFSVTICLIFGGFSWAYAPDVHMKDWAQREAFIQLRCREKKGLPPIDPNYIDPKTMKLPSESELENVEIII
ncbi:NADH dehydrogenase 1 beta subcomplex subunit 11, mitochondrial [Eumeta japonica]|uniref:NADH dehydrogenase [ubiquinone] 1 beta subcomplex subunit 11, mitochondrial n=1 Tax=Eumeta variegata TaxID=151549 RepID=A0A4C1UWT6_EUMVA|nr:NADH dehydrogenase 1 beta subcomplex subunit 11, mitochondrial [Eumeta japonica]